MTKIGNTFHNHKKKYGWYIAQGQTMAYPLCIYKTGLFSHVTFGRLPIAITRTFREKEKGPSFREFELPGGETKWQNY